MVSRHGATNGERGCSQGTERSSNGEQINSNRYYSKALRTSRRRQIWGLILRIQMRNS